MDSQSKPRRNVINNEVLKGPRTDNPFFCEASWIYRYVYYIKMFIVLLLLNKVYCIALYRIHY